MLLMPCPKLTCALTACVAIAISAPAVQAQSVGAASTTGSSQGNADAAGGAADADFDSLIDLIVSTVATDSWAENGGGEAEIRPFPTGVMVDTAGTLALLDVSAGAEMARRHAEGQLRLAGQGDARRSSPLRYISLARLEREIIRRQDARQPLDEAMLTLAGLERVRYVFVYPETNDLVLAGPAGDWRVDSVGRLVARESGQPIVRLDDLVTLLRRALPAPESFFGCMINPRQTSLADTQAFLDRSSRRPLDPRRRDAWLEQLRTTLGRQDIEIFGIEPANRVARILVEADVHMKLIGMGLESAVPGVDSYLDSVVATGGQPAAMSMLRWWFALQYDALRASSDGNAIELVGPGVRLLSENELLAAQGRRIHTGQSDRLNKQFADSFTTHFAALAEKYPVFSELRNLFDLSLVVALCHTEGLFEKSGWRPTRLVDAERLPLPPWPVPCEVDTVANYREASRRQLIAGVSGGVMIETKGILIRPREIVESSKLPLRAESVPAPNGESAIWWWDAGVQ